MTILSLYQKYSIPLNLQKHMLRVTAVGLIICENFKPKINKHLVVKALLLHDMGNILKMDFNRLDFFEPDDLGRLDYYQDIKKLYQRKYGLDADQATLEIVKEITGDQKLVELIKGSHGDHLDEFINSPNWEPKICYYSDMRIGPHGLLNLNDRFSDLKKRYPHELQELERYHQQAITIEARLQHATTKNLNNILSTDIESTIETLKHTRF